MAAVQECLKEVRLGRIRQQETYTIELKRYHDAFIGKQEHFAHRLKKGRVLAYYQSLLKNSYTKQQSPKPSTLRKEAMLLFVSHQIEVTERAMEHLRSATTRMSQYMQCEMAVMRDEHDDLEAAFRVQQSVHNKERARLEAPLKHKMRVQQMVLSHLQSLIQMRQEIRRHSLHYFEKGVVCGDDNVEYDYDTMHHTSDRPSFERHDLNQSLRLVSATFEESFSQLEESPIPREKESMVSLMKQLLELDGTFPTGPEHDEFLEQSLSNVLCIEHLWEDNENNKNDSNTTTIAPVNANRSIMGFGRRPRKARAVAA